MPKGRNGSIFFPFAVRTCSRVVWNSILPERRSRKLFRLPSVYEKNESVSSQDKNVLGVDLSEIPIEIADVIEPSSLESLAAKSKIILNCVGPVSQKLPH